MPTSRASRTAPTLAVASTAAFLEALAVALDAHEMPLQQLQLLLQLFLHGELEQHQLPKFTKVERSANSRNVRKLGSGEKPWLQPGPGLVESYDYPRDLQVKIVRLTPKGRAVIEEAAAAVSSLLSP